MTDTKADPLREALKPFAAVANFISLQSPDDHQLLPQYGLTIRHFRAALAALAAPQPAAHENLGSPEWNEAVRLAATSRQPHAPLEGRARFSFIYKNHRGEIASRSVSPIFVRFGSTEWHQEPQWLMRAFDHDKNAEREFAMVDMSQPPAQDAAERCATDAAYETLPTSGNACADCTAENCAYIRGGYGRCPDGAKSELHTIAAPVVASGGGRAEIIQALVDHFKSVIGASAGMPFAETKVDLPIKSFEGYADAILAAFPTDPVSDRAAVIEECARVADAAAVTAGKNYGASESAGALMAARRIRALVAKGDAK